MSEKRTYSATEARDELINCFISAHAKEVEGPLNEIGATDEQKREAIVEMIRSSFRKTGGDFDHPTKKSVTAAMENLAGIAKHFRDQATIKKHVGYMMSVLENTK